MDTEGSSPPPFVRNWRIRRVSSKCLLSQQTELDGKKPNSIVKRKTVITLSSSGDDNNKTRHSWSAPDPDVTCSTTAEVGETACGRISIQVKSMDNNSQFTVNDEECWQGRDSVPLKSSTVRDPSWISSSLNKENDCRSLILIETPTTQHQDRPEKSFESYQDSTINFDDTKSHPLDSSVGTIDYLDWLKSLDSWKSDSKKGHRVVSFDPMAEEEDESVPEEDEEEEMTIQNPARVVVIETVKSIAPPKSILKNRSSSADPFQLVEDEAQKLARKLEYHQRNAQLGSRLMSLASGEEEMSFTGTLIDQQEAQQQTIRKLRHHSPLSALINPEDEPRLYYSSLVPEWTHQSDSTTNRVEKANNPSVEFHRALVHDPPPEETLKSLPPSSPLPKVVAAVIRSDSTRNDVSIQKSKDAKSRQVDVVGWNKINSVVVQRPCSATTGISSGMPVDKATELVRQFFTNNDQQITIMDHHQKRPDSNPGTRSLKHNKNNKDSIRRKLSLPETSLVADLAHFGSLQQNSSGEEEEEDSSSGGSDLGSSSSSTLLLDSSGGSSLDGSNRAPSSVAEVNPDENQSKRGRSPVRRSRIPLLIARPLRSSSFVLTKFIDEPLSINQEPKSVGFIPSNGIQQPTKAVNNNRARSEDPRRPTSASRSRPRKPINVAPRVNTNRKTKKMASPTA